MNTALIVQQKPQYMMMEEAGNLSPKLYEILVSNTYFTSVFSTSLPKPRATEMS